METFAWGCKIQCYRKKKQENVQNHKFGAKCKSNHFFNSTVCCFGTVTKLYIILGLHGDMHFNVIIKVLHWKKMHRFTFPFHDTLRFAKLNKFVLHVSDVLCGRAHLIWPKTNCPSATWARLCDPGYLWLFLINVKLTRPANHINLYPCCILQECRLMPSANSNENADIECRNN